MRTPKNLGASVRQKLLDISRERGDDFNLLLTRYAIERLLYRLSLSAHRDQFVLKGAGLYAVWQSEANAISYRPTLDLDLWSFGSPDVARVSGILREIVATPVENDGISFDADTIKGAAQRADEDYQGCGISMGAILDGIPIRVAIDFGFGDAITPAPPTVDYPTILPNSAVPTLRIYPRETVVAEKFEAMVDLDMTNSRLKDFYDLWMLCQNFEFDGAILSEALRQTFERRRTALPDEMPTALTDRFSGDAAKMTQWRSFGKRVRASDLPPLREIIEQLQHFCCHF